MGGPFKPSVCKVTGHPFQFVTGHPFQFAKFLRSSRGEGKWETLRVFQGGRAAVFSSPFV